MSERLREWLRRLMSWSRRRARDRDFEDELQAHVALAASEEMSRGVPAAEARRRALARLGGVDAAREQHRDARGLPWIVLERDDAVAGYAYAGPFRDRVAYRHTLEATVYLAPEVRRGGLGTALYAALIERLRGLSEGEHAPVHSVMGVVALPHPGSVALHSRLGFRHVGTIEDAGFKFDRWIDVGYWQLTL